MYHHPTMVRKILCLKEALIMQGQILKKGSLAYFRNKKTWHDLSTFKHKYMTNLKQK